MGKKKKRLQIQRKDLRKHKTVVELDPRWVRAQLDLKPGWESVLEAMDLENTPNLQNSPIEDKAEDE